MDFFKSILADDPEPSDSESPPSSPPPATLQSEESQPPPPAPNPNPNMATITNAWTFGSSLFKTLASKSETVIETYRRDLQEFSSGLKKETETIREAASRAVKDLPSRLETGAAMAQESLESVGDAIDKIGISVTEIVAHGKDSILADDSDSDSIEINKQISSSQRDLNFNSKPYSRLDAQIQAIQCDFKTYCDEPEDLDEYNEWKLGFDLGENVGEIEDLIEENGAMEEIYNEIVPSKVDRDTFWIRYFYRVYKVKKAEQARAKLVKRVISGEEEEELSWDVDDEYEDSEGSKLKCDLDQVVEKTDSLEKYVDDSEVNTEVKILERENVDKEVVSEGKSGGEVDEKGGDDKEALEEKLDEPKSVDDKAGVDSAEKMSSEGKTDNGGSCKDSDFSVVSSHVSSHEEDLEWDEIEDIGNNDEIKVTANRTDLRKRLSAAEEEEDLTWDIEDDDEPAKS